MYIQIPALFSSLDRASDYAHSPIVAPQSPPQLSRALRPTQMHTVPSLTPGCRWYALRSLSLSLSLSPPYVGGKRLASSMLRRVLRREEKRVERGGDLSRRKARLPRPDPGARREAGPPAVKGARRVAGPPVANAAKSAPPFG